MTGTRHDAGSVAAPARGRRPLWLLGGGVVAALLLATALVLWSGDDGACACAPDPDQGAVVGYGVFGPGEDAVRARLEVVDAVAFEHHTRLVLEFTNQGDGDTRFDPAYFTGGEDLGAGPGDGGDGFRIMDPDLTELHPNHLGAGGSAPSDQVWRVDVPYRVVVFAAAQPADRDTVTVRSPGGEYLFEEVPLREPGSASEEEERDRELATEGELLFPTEEPAPETAAEPVPVFAPPAEEARIPSPLPEAERLTYREEGADRTWVLTVERLWRVPEQDRAVLSYSLRLAEGEVPDQLPEGLPESLGATLVDPETGLAHQELRLGDPDGVSVPLSAFPWRTVQGNYVLSEGRIHLTAPPEDVATVALNAGVFGWTEVPLH